MAKAKPNKKAEEPNNDSANTKPAEDQFLIAGLGASAGGIQAFQEFFNNVPANTGIAYVVILHLSPDHDSKLAEVLQTTTKIPVTQVNEKTKIEADHVYVVPPNQHLTMQDGFIIVSPNMQIEDRRAPVDIFFRTLAEEHGTRAIAIILSGTGANGSMGLKRIKEKGGAAFVQNPREAEFNEMPRNSIATGFVDEVLNVADLPAKIVAYKNSLGKIQISEEPEQRPQDQQQALRDVFSELRVRTGHDFSNYKRPTLLRRIERRINIHNLPDLPSYVTYMLQNPEETNALLKDLLISVTNFFRDRKPFEIIENEVLPLLIKGKTNEDQLRIWVPGCATGEEAYSLAILCAEKLTGNIDGAKVQIFATDIDEGAIAHARDGLYNINDLADVSPERLRRFFNKEGDNYRIRREIRETIMFANHNFLKDPPFSHLDLISCRNVMIYLNHVAQERVTETFHFALNPGGFLFLGSSESVDGATDLYATYNRENHIFQSRQAAPRAYPIPESVPNFRIETTNAFARQEKENKILERISYGDLHQQLLEQYAAPSIVVNEEYEIVHLSERAGRYLQITGGEPSQNLLKLIRSELRLELRSALYQAMQRQSAVEARGLKINIEDYAEIINIQVRPVLRADDTARGFILVLFEPAIEQGSQEILLTSDEPVARHLEEELMRLKTQLRSSSEQHEYQSEELKASNEELQAMNEELRSSAEELETSKEELQSINEELRTVNQELKVKIEEATLVSNNLQNLINSTDIGTIFLDRSFHVVLFTPSARNIFNLIPADYGRLLSDITHRLEHDGLLHDAESVLEKLHTIEKEVRTKEGRDFLMRLTPYRTDEDRIKGVVMTFVDITERKKADEAMRISEEKYRTLFNSIDEGFTLIEMLFNEEGIAYDCIIRDVNPAQTRIDGFTATIGRRIKEMLPEMEMKWFQRYGNIALTGVAEHFEDWSEAKQCWYEVNASRVGGEASMLVAIVYNDITERKQREEQQKFLLKLSDALRSVANPVEMQHAAMKLLVEQLQVMRAGYYEVEADQESFGMNAGYEVDAIPMPKRMRLSDFSKSLSDEYRSGKTQFVCDSEKEVNDENQEAYRALNVRAWAAVPLVKNGQLVAVVGVHTKTARNWTPVELKMLEDLAERTWAAVERARAEEALRQSEAQLSAVFDVVPTGLALADASGKILRFNKALHKIWGTPPVPQNTGEYAEWKAKRVDTCEPLKAEDWAMSKALSTGDIVQGDILEIERFDGGTAIIINAAAPIRDAAGNITGGVVAEVDITAQQQAEQALRRSEERLQRIVNIPRVGVLTFDYSGKLLHANDAFLEMLGYEREEFNTQQFTWRDFTPPHYVVASMQIMEQIRKTKRGGPYEKEYFLKDGSTKWMMFVAADLEDGTIVEYAVDISERKEVEAALSESEVRLQLALDSATMGTFVYYPQEDRGEPDEKMLSIFGLPLGGILNLNEALTHIIHPDDRKRYANDVAKAVDTKGDGKLDSDIRIIHPDGSLHWVNVTGQVIFEDGKAVRMPGVSTDITERKNAQEALRKSETQLRALVENLPGGAVFIVDKDLRYLLAEGEALINAGTKSEDFLGKTVDEVVYNEVIDSRKTNYLKAFAGQSFIDEHQVNGRTYISRGVPLKNSDGDVFAALAISYDITERKKAEENLRKSEERLQKAIQIGTVGVIFFDDKGNISEANDAFFEMSGITVEQLNDHQVNLNSITPPEWIPAMEKAMQELITIGVATPYEKQLQKPDGSRWWGLCAKARVGNNENVEYIIDVTQRKNIEEALRESEERLRIAVEAGQLATWDWNMQTNKIRWNDQHFKLFGREPVNEEMQPDDFLNQIHKADMHYVKRQLEDAINSTGVYHAIFRIIKENTNEICWMSGYGRVTERKNGKPTRMTGVMYDITENKRLEQQKDEFMGIASHELKTPVTSIKAYADILNDHFNDTNDTYSLSLITRLNNQVERLNRLITDLLDITRINEGHLRFREEEFDMNELIKEATEDVQQTSPKHVIESDLQPLKKIWGDRERISQVVLNLLTNAIKYSPDANKIIITSASDDKEVTVSVQDFGVGMLPDVQQKVFDRFYRYKGGKTNTFQGLGLGLFIAAGIIKKHNGNISVKSEPGKGSTFSFTIPFGKNLEEN